MLVVLFFVFLVEIFLQWKMKMLGFGVGNSGISFGLFDGMPVSFLIFILGILFWFMKKNLGIGEKLVLLGAAANLVSRMILGGMVWDYLFIPYLNLWFNGADVLIALGFTKIVWPWKKSG